jgi:hypothetical protein
MTAKLKKHQSVWRRQDSRGVQTSAQIFMEDSEDRARANAHWLHHEVWVDMGEPDTITITIEPGDKLNEEGSA